MATPVQTRWRMLAAIERDEPIASGERRLEVATQGLRTPRRTVEQRATLEPGETGSKPHSQPTDDDLNLTRKQIAANSSATLYELHGMAGAHVAVSAVCGANNRGLRFYERCGTSASRHGPAAVKYS